MKIALYLIVFAVLLAAGVALLFGRKSVKFHFTSNQWPQYLMEAGHTKPCVLFGKSLLPETLHVSVVDAESGKRLGARSAWVKPADGFLRFHDALLRNDSVAIFTYDPQTRRSDRDRSAVPPLNNPGASLEVPIGRAKE